MTAETIQLIQTGINLLCASGVISTLLYYNSRKRKEAALASQEENKTISSYADEWKALYERSNESVVNLNSKIDELYEEINQYRITIRNLRDEKNDLKLALHEAQWNRCIKDGCQLRTPPRKRESLETLVEKDATLGGAGIAGTEGDVAGRIFIEQGAVEQRTAAVDGTGSGHEGHFADAAGTGVGVQQLPQQLRPLLGPVLDDLAILKGDMEALDELAVEEQGVDEFPVGIL